MQAVFLAREAQHVSRGVQRGKIHAHERFIGKNAAVLRVDNRLEVIGDKLLVDETAELLMAASFLQVGAVDLGVEFQQLALARVLDLIHGKVRVFAQCDEICAALGIPRDTAGDAHAQLTSAGKLDDRLLKGGFQRADVCAQRILIVVAVEESIELIAADARADGTRGSVLGKAFACAADVLVAPVVAECVVYLLEVVEVEHQKRRVAELFG